MGVLINTSQNEEMWPRGKYEFKDRYSLESGKVETLATPQKNVAGGHYGRLGSKSVSIL